MKTGKKIKKARSFYDMSQKLLGDLVGLPRDRVGAYEAGTRNPKDKQIEEFAKALSVPVEYFTDHNIESVEDAFMVLFELEETYGLSVDLVQTTDSTADNPKFTYALSTHDPLFNTYLEKWHDKKKQLLSGEITQIEYDRWCARLRLSVEEDKQDDLHRKMIRQIEKDKKDKK